MNNLAPFYMAKPCTLGERHARYALPPVGSLRTLLAMSADRSLRTMLRASPLRARSGRC